jgi:hypothetical protein
MSRVQLRRRQPLSWPRVPGRPKPTTNPNSGCGINGNYDVETAQAPNTSNSLELCGARVFGYLNSAQSLLFDT